MGRAIFLDNDLCSCNGDPGSEEGWGFKFLCFLSRSRGCDLPLSLPTRGRVVEFSCLPSGVVDDRENFFDSITLPLNRWCLGEDTGELGSDLVLSRQR